MLLITGLGGVSREASTHTSAMHPRDGNSSLQACNQRRHCRRGEHRRSIRGRGLLSELPSRKLRIRRRGEQPTRRRSSETAMATHILRQEIQVEVEQRVPAFEKDVDSSRHLP